MPMDYTYLSYLAKAGFGTNHTSDFPAIYYVGLSTAEYWTTAVEPTGNGYARVALTNTTSDNGTTNGFTTPSGGLVHNNAVLTFPTATGSWGTIKTFVLYTSSTGGTEVCRGNLSEFITVTTDMVLQFPPNTISINVTG